MTNSWQTLETLFREAAALPLKQRKEFLGSPRVSRTDVGRRLEEMLLQHDRHGVLDAAPVPTADRPGADSLVGRRIGHYLVLRVIASGGMGVVYEARQEHPSRSVALKIMHQHLLNPNAMARFTFEAEALGRLHHPAIAQIHEAGVFESDAGSQPFLAMELVAGASLTEYAQQRRLSMRQRVALMIRICAGVQHAHHQGVLHRDLKPANILVAAGAPRSAGADHESGLTELEPIDQPKILDFGIARAVNRAESMMVRTATGQLIGTLNYMSPEQVTADPAAVDQRSDVYSLGVIAYELLSGRHPHDLAKLSVPEAARVIGQEETTRLAALDRRFRGDLDTIVGKALEKDPSRRYQSAQQLADDLRRFLQDEPILARAPSTLYQLRKFARRHQSIAAALAAVFVILILGIVGMLWQWNAAIEQRDLALEAERAAEASLDQAVDSALSTIGIIDDHLPNIPGSTSLRLTLANDVLEGLGKLPPDRGVPYALGYAHQRLGEVLMTMGRSEAALESFQQSLAIRQSIVDSGQPQPRAQRTLGVAHWKFAEALLIQGRFDQAAEHNRIGLDLHQNNPEVDLQSKGYLGIALRRLAEVDAATGRHQEALENLDAALSQFQLMQSDQPTASQQRSVAMAWRTRGESLAGLARHGEALDALERSRTLTREIAGQTHGADVWTRGHEARIEIAFARVLGELDRWSEALAAADHAAALSGQLSEADPLDAESRHLLGRALLAMAQATHQSPQLEASQALSAAHQATEVLQALHAQDARNWWVATDLAAAQRLLQLDSPAD